MVTLTVWDYNSQLKQKVINTQVEGRTIILLLPDGNTLVSGDKNGHIKYWDINSGTMSTEVVAHNNAITQLIYNETQDVIVSASMDGYIKFWDLTSHDYKTSSFVHPGGVTDLSIKEDGSEFITCGMDGKFNYYLYPELIKVFTFSNYRFKDYLTTSLSPNGSSLLVAGNRSVGVFINSSSWIIK